MRGSRTNGLVEWLGTCLERAGVPVWHDLARLNDGSFLRDKIAASMRSDSFRFTLAASKASSGLAEIWLVCLTSAVTMQRDADRFTLS